MKKTQKIKYVLIGFTAAILVVILTFGAMAAMTEKTITVLTGINIYHDDIKLNPTDVNGKPVELFAYNGTTYLPIRAVANMFDTNIQWEGSTFSVYIGKHSSTKPALYLQDLTWFTGSNWKTILSDKDNLGNERTNVIYNDSIIEGAINNIYKTNGKYTKMAGTLFMPFNRRNETTVTSFIVYGDGKQLYAAEMKGGIEPIDFNIDLRGVLELRIEFFHKQYTTKYMPYARLSNVGLWT